MADEKSSLLGSSSGAEPKNFYFLTKTKSQRGEEGSSSAAVTKTGAIEMQATSAAAPASAPSQAPQGTPPPQASWLDGLFGRKRSETGIVKPRAVRAVTRWGLGGCDYHIQCLL